VVAAMTAESLWVRVAAGDADAFAELFRQHADRVHGFCVRRSGSVDVAEEVTSAVFLAAWRRRGDVELESDDHVLPWLLGVAANLLRNAGRKQRRYERFLATAPAPPPDPDFSGEVDDRLDSARRMRLLAAALATLDDDDRDLILLVVAEDLTPTQVAVAMGIPAGTVRSRLSRSRARLRAAYAALEAEGRKRP
jgi:RNA polymerase sigma factor (sigma-70 family)